jgi:hypothetical protein
LIPQHMEIQRTRLKNRQTPEFSDNHRVVDVTEIQE